MSRLLDWLSNKWGEWQATREARERNRRLNLVRCGLCPTCAGEGWTYFIEHDAPCRCTACHGSKRANAQALAWLAAWDNFYGMSGQDRKGGR